MSWKKFEHTLNDRPDLSKVFPELHTGLSQVLRKNPEASLDADALSALLKLKSGDILDLLILMEKEELLETLLSWECSKGDGITKEAKNATEFPSFILCDQCGEMHEFNKECITVHFVATEELLESIA